jgi:phosphotransferase system enzyme I (PtsI)
MEHSRLPDEQEQYAAYRAVVEVFGDKPVILRTLDIGGDKEMPYMEMPAKSFGCPKDSRGGSQPRRWKGR